jgi:predicted 3-demethylubiquinone-9 3-methyltransferase (glyoxalase superfamily)
MNSRRLRESTFTSYPDRASVPMEVEMTLTGMTLTQRIKPFLWFDGKAEEAARFYVSIFGDSKIESTGSMATRFQIEGMQFIALNGGPQYAFSPAVSFLVNCETQAEVDELWSRLSEGGETQQCGWLKDRFGLSWQIVPTVLGDMLNDDDDEKSERVMQAMLQMDKIDIAALKRAYEG